MSDRSNIKIGSRSSVLALIQTEFVKEKLEDSASDVSFDLICMVTKGDKILDVPLPKVGKNVFTKELEVPLVNQELDIAVHSLKDVATNLPDGLVIGAVLEREDPRDVVILRQDFNGKKLAELPPGSKVGTSSLRRAAQLRRRHPALIVTDIRGNLNTRLRKLDDKECDFAAIVLACAGVKRMGWDDRISEVLPPSEMLYAVGQGALAVECRTDDDTTLSLLEPLNEINTVLRVIAERTFMQALGGGCTAPLAVHSEVKDSKLSLTGAVWCLDGSRELLHSMTTCLSSTTEEPPRKIQHITPRQFTGILARNIDLKQQESAHQLGLDLAEHLKSLGAADIIAEAKKEVDAPFVSNNGQS